MITVTIAGVNVTSSLASFNRESALCQPGGKLSLVFSPTFAIPTPWDDVTLTENGTLTFTGYVASAGRRKSGGETVTIVECADTWLRAARAWNITRNRKSSGESLKTWITTLLGEAGLTVSYTESNDPEVPADYPIPIDSYAGLVLDLLKLAGWYMRVKPDGTIEVGLFGGTPTTLTGFDFFERTYDDSTYRNVAKVYGINAQSVASDTNLFDYVDRITVLDVAVDQQSSLDSLAAQVLNSFNRPRNIGRVELVADATLEVGDQVVVSDNGQTVDSQITKIVNSLDAEKGHKSNLIIGDLCPKLFGYGYNSSGSTTGTGCPPPLVWDNTLQQCVQGCPPGCHWDPVLLRCVCPPPPDCTYAPWHQHVVFCKHDHIWETYDFGGVCAPTAPTWVDIKGNIEGSITGFAVLADGTMLALTSSGSSTGVTHNYDTGGYVWKRVSTFIWLRSQSAQQIGPWTRVTWDEDGTGPHGLTDASCIYAPCGGGIGHWTYVADAHLLDIIGQIVSTANSNGTVIFNGSDLHNGTWFAGIDFVISSQNPQGFRLEPPIVSEVCADTVPPSGTCVSGGATLPTVWDKGKGILLGSIAPPHFSAYPDEAYHHFDLRFNFGFTPPDLFFDGLPSSVYGPHFTDESGRVWCWTGTQLLRNDGVPPLAASWQILLATQIASGYFSVNIPPGSNIRYAADGGNNLWKSTDDGGSWTMIPGPAGIAPYDPDSTHDVFTAPGEPERIYVVGRQGSLFVSEDEGQHWYTRFDNGSAFGGQGPAVGLWVDTDS